MSVTCLAHKDKDILLDFCPWNYPTQIGWHFQIRKQLRLSTVWLINNSIFYFIIIGIFLPSDHPGAKLSSFGAPTEDDNDNERGAYAALIAAKKLKNV